MLDDDYLHMICIKANNAGSDKRILYPYNFSKDNGVVICSCNEILNARIFPLQNSV